MTQILDTLALRSMRRARLASSLRRMASYDIPRNTAGSPVSPRPRHSMKGSNYRGTEDGGTRVPRPSCVCREIDRLDLAGTSQHIARL